MAYVTKGTTASTLNVGDSSSYLSSGYWEITSDQYDKINSGGLDAATTKGGDATASSDQPALPSNIPWTTSSGVTVNLRQYTNFGTEQEYHDWAKSQDRFKDGNSGATYTGTTTVPTAPAPTTEPTAPASSGNTPISWAALEAALDPVTFAILKKQNSAEVDRYIRQLAAQPGASNSGSYTVEGWLKGYSSYRPGNTTYDAMAKTMGVTQEPEKATLISPDGKNKTAVEIGSSDASTLQGAGWTVSTSENVGSASEMPIADALKWKPAVTAPTDGTITDTTGGTTAGQKDTSHIILPPDLQTKLYEATGRIQPDYDDLLNFEYNPTLFERQLDDMIGATGTAGEQDQGEVDISHIVLPPELQTKLYEATGRIQPDRDDLLNFQYNPELFERQLDDKIKATGDQGEETLDQPEIPEELGQVFFRGEEALVKFADDPNIAGQPNTSTVWLINKTDKTIRPFMSEEAFNNYYGSSTALTDNADSIMTISEGALVNELSGLHGFDLLQDEYGVQNDGTFKPVDIKEGDFEQLYGKEENEDLTRQTLSMLYNWTDIAGADEQIGISQDMINAVKGDNQLLAFYVNALAYGEYTPVDILKDIKRRELIKGGNTQLENVKIIDGIQNAGTYKATDEWAQANSNPALNMPESISDIDSSSFDLSIFDLPSEVFQTLVQPVDWDSPDAREEIDKIKSAYHDVLAQSLDANTERERVLAKQEWDNFRKEVQRLYGIELGENATTAYNQIENITNQARGAGISGSGIEKEAMDDMLKVVRGRDEALRSKKLDTEGEAKRQYYLTSASPEEIAKLSQEEKEKYGLIPDEETLAFFDVSTLMNKYGISKEEAELYRSLMLDEGGNYNSKLFRDSAEKMYNINLGKKGFQESQYLEGKLGEEEKKYWDFTRGEGVIDYRPGNGTPGGSTPDPSDSTQWGVSQIKPTGDTKLVDPTTTLPSQTAKTLKDYSVEWAQPTENTEWADFTKDKQDVLGYNWEGYTPIKFGEDQTKYKNIQNTGNTLYGYKA